MDEVEVTYDGDDRIESYIEFNPNTTKESREGTLTYRLSSMLGSQHPLVRIARQFEVNSIQRDDVLEAMAARNGIYIPSRNYGVDRAYYTFLDGQSTIREYSQRIVELATQCLERGISGEEVSSWIASTPRQVQFAARSLGIDIPDDEADEENEYYADRIAFFLRVREIGNELKQ